MSHRRIISWASAAALAVALGGCASPYGPHGITGGFNEKKLGPNTYWVNYSGNGYTDEDQVVLYWLYRCAELTQENGYSYFGIVPESGRPTSRLEHDPGALKRLTTYNPQDDEPSTLKVKGGGFVYIPSFSTYTVRTWHKRATIVMYHSRAGALTSEQAYALHAGMVMDKLRAYVKGGERSSAPHRRELIEAAMRHTPGFAGDAVQDLPETVVRPAK